eukprot:UN3376
MVFFPPPPTRGKRNKAPSLPGFSAGRRGFCPPRRPLGDPSSRTPPNFFFFETRTGSGSPSPTPAPGLAPKPPGTLGFSFTFSRVGKNHRPPPLGVNPPLELWRVWELSRNKAANPNPPPMESSSRKELKAPPRAAIFVTHSLKTTGGNGPFWKGGFTLGEQSLANFFTF